MRLRKPRQTVLTFLTRQTFFKIPDCVYDLHPVLATGLFVLALVLGIVGLAVWGVW